ncbi:MAG: hypothetical protein PHW47_13795, partial [Lachnospira sp.]|nr:hypothetical protein [Lachnospira sp.]
GAKRRIFRWTCQVFLAKKVGDFIEKESESLEFIGLEIPRDYCYVKGEHITTHSSITAKSFFQHRGYRIILEQEVVRHGITLKNYVMMK